MADPVAITAEFLNEVKRQVRDGEESRKGYLYREAAEGSPVRIRISAASISIVAQAYLPARGYNGYFTIEKFRVSDPVPIAKRAVAAALKDARDYKHERSTQSNADLYEARQVDQWAKATNRECFNIYIARIKSDGGIRSIYDRERYIQKNFLNYPLPSYLKGPGLNTFGDAPLGHVDPEAADKWIRTIEQKYGKHPARLTRSYTNAMFSFLVKKMRMPKRLKFPETNAIEFDDDALIRNNPLSDGQIRKLWQATQKLEPLGHDLVQCVMLTARRRGEFERLEWSMLDFDEGVINFPARSMKNKRTYQLPLTPLVAQILKNRPSLNGSPYVFATVRGNPYQDKDLIPHVDAIMAKTPFTKAEYDACGQPNKPKNRSRALAQFDWRIHDFRATARRLLRRAEPRYTQDHIKTVLGHAGNAKGSAIAHYDADIGLIDFKREIFSLLEREVLRVVDPENSNIGQGSTELAEIAALEARLKELRAKV